ncbi:FliH/SctL family protein [Georgenia sp. SYP-B2076]|uniref:FliH/SctL family protein n=1 Tax=Georgenia sp. SYP-B2076 TaxID=2495881 RepID=UPI000F8C7D1D|nr:FliH/SctL family protein [Georgenia sp. SYP-B2076]
MSPDAARSGFVLAAPASLSAVPARLPDGAAPSAGPVTFTPASVESVSVSAASADGYASGYAAGWASGMRAATQAAAAEAARVAAAEAARAQHRTAEAEAALAALAQAASAARRRTAPVVDAALTEVRHGALELAQAVLGVELATGETSARAALLRALTVQGEADVVRVRLSPEDHAQVRALIEAHPGELDIPAGVELAADPALARGDAISDLTDGYLDARISAAVERARAALEVR